MTDRHNQTDSSDLMTPVEAAEFLRLSVRSLARYEELGKLTALRLPGGHRRYRRVDVESLIAAKRNEAAS